MNNLRIIHVIFLALFFGTFSSCQEEVDFEPSLFTEEVLYLSGERVRLLGRVITNQNIEASDHGFQVSESEQFSQPIVISLGERTGPGRFIGESNGLEAGTTYYARAFLRTGSEEIFGNTITLQSLVPAVLDMVPNNGKPGIVVTISGRNFTSDTQVFFGPNRGVVQGIDFESNIRVIVPAATVSPVVQVRVVSQGREMILPLPFEYTTGKFNSIGVFPGGLRLFDNIALQEGRDFYVGLGNLTQGFGQSLNNRLWKYNLGNGSWTEVSFPGGNHFRAFSTGKYFGGGLVSFTINPSNATLDFWKLENGSFVQLRDLPRPAYLAAAFETADAVYVLGGGFGVEKEILKYSKATDAWSRISDAPISINLNVMNFHYQGKQYFIDQASKGLYEFNPADESWNVVSVYPGVLTNIKGFGLTIGNFAYVGLENRSEKVWELDLRTMNWVAKNDFPGLAQGQNVGVFQDLGNIYILRNGEIQVSGSMQFWVFDPKGF
jgi:hypothetical protein